MLLPAQTQQNLCMQTITIPSVGTLTYTLIENRMPAGNRYYSITVVLQNTVSYQEKAVQNLTNDRQLAMRLFWMVCRGTVTPCTLTEVLSDLLE